MCIYIYTYIYIYYIMLYYILIKLYYIILHSLKQNLVHDTQSAQQAQSKEHNTYTVKS